MCCAFSCVAQYSFSSDTTKNPYRHTRLYFAVNHGTSSISSGPFSKSRGGYYYFVGNYNISALYRIGQNFSVGPQFGQGYTLASSHEEYYYASQIGLRAEYHFLSKSPLMKRILYFTLASELFAQDGRFQFINGLDSANNVTSHTSGKINSTHWIVYASVRLRLNYKPERIMNIYWAPEMGLSIPVGFPSALGHGFLVGGSLMRFTFEFRR